MSAGVDWLPTLGRNRTTFRILLGAWLDAELSICANFHLVALTTEFQLKVDKMALPRT